MTELDLITIEELAAMCRAPLKSVRNHWVYKSGFPKPYKPGKRLLWNRPEVSQWLETTRTSA